ncbi:hypothetical protein PSHT_09056, partial [Puccinia striiformis]|uniref:Secreted protein n=2 Tax=Puccinia striiformis TaxID=27350 RepID=A0A0L0V421_9BASI
MKISDWFPILAVLLFQGEGLYVQSFGCVGIKGHEAYKYSACAKLTFYKPTVSLIAPPWDTVRATYDCSHTLHPRVTCCKVEVTKKSIGGRTTVQTSTDHQYKGGSNEWKSRDTSRKSYVLAPIPDSSALTNLAEKAHGICTETIRTTD